MNFWSAWISRLALVPDAQDANQIELWIVPIQREVSGRSPGNDKLTPVAIRAASDFRMLHQNFDRAANTSDRRGSILHRVLKQMLDDAIEIAERFRGINYPRHRTGLGRFAAWPCTFAAM